MEEAMEYQEVYKGLKKRALSFHKVLVNESVYQKQLSEDAFLNLIKDQLKDSAEGITNGRIDPWVNVLGFCEALLFDLEDFLFTVTYDAMEGPQEHLGALKTLLTKVGYEFSWEIDEETNQIHFKVEDIEWSGPRVDAWWLTDPDFFSEETPNLIDFLDNEGWFLFLAGTGDATGRYLLVPLNSKEELKKFLVPGFCQRHKEFDPRIAWLYEGVPKDERPEDLWEI